MSLTNRELFDLNSLTTATQITDLYLAALAFHRHGRLATFNLSIPWRAVKGGTADLVDQIAI